MSFHVPIPFPCFLYLKALFSWNTVLYPSFYRHYRLLTWDGSPIQPAPIIEDPQVVAVGVTHSNFMLCLKLSTPQPSRLQFEPPESPSPGHRQPRRWAIWSFYPKHGICSFPALLCLCALPYCTVAGLQRWFRSPEKRRQTVDISMVAFAKTCFCLHTS